MLSVEFTDGTVEAWLAVACWIDVPTLSLELVPVVVGDDKVGCAVPAVVIGTVCDVPVGIIVFVGLVTTEGLEAEFPLEVADV